MGRANSYSGGSKLKLTLRDMLRQAPVDDETLTGQIIAPKGRYSRDNALPADVLKRARCAGLRAVEPTTARKQSPQQSGRPKATYGRLTVCAVSFLGCGAVLFGLAVVGTCSIQPIFREERRLV